MVPKTFTIYHKIILLENPPTALSSQIKPIFNRPFFLFTLTMVNMESIFFIGKLDCKDCPPGFYCVSGAQEPVPCPKGTYNALIRRESLADCRSCISGMACPRSGLTWPPVKCDAGYYCPAGSSLPNETIHACPAGTYTDRHDLTHDRECTSCPERQSCEAGTGGKQKPPQECATGEVFFYFCTNWNI